MNQKAFDRLTLINFSKTTPVSALASIVVTDLHQRTSKTTANFSLLAQFTGKASARLEPSPKTGCSLTPAMGHHSRYIREKASLGYEKRKRVQLLFR